MSESAQNTPSPNTISWALWQGLEPLFGSQSSFPLAQLQAVKSEPADYASERDRVLQALKQTIPDRRECMVPGCRTVDCNLGTHRNYEPDARKRTQTHQYLGTRAREALKQLQRYSHSDPTSDGVDGFPSLPVAETLNPDIRALFHFFFIKIFDKLAQIFRGPSATGLPDFKDRMLATALTSEMYCRALILQARTEQDLAKLSFTETKESLVLYNDTLTAVRGQIELIYARPHPLQIELALLVLCVLMAYDTAHGRTDTSRLHWQGLQDLVRLRGGMHCVTMALAYVIHADRESAIRYDVLPTYTSTLSVSLPMPAPSPGSLRQGAKFTSMKSKSNRVNQEVVDYLIDTAVLVELWEESRAPKTQKGNRGLAVSAGYLHYVRDQLHERFAILNSQWAKIESIERSLLWAARIIEYPCTWSNYLRSSNINLCYKLATSLGRKPRNADWWSNDLDEFTWVMFTLATVETQLDIHDWCLNCLRDVLTEKYGGVPWPRTWWADEQANLLDFVWSSIQYGNDFKRICDELEKPPGNIS